MKTLSWLESCEVLWKLSPGLVQEGEVVQWFMEYSAESYETTF